MTASKISESKAKSLFRAASKIRPESIVTLKQSLAKSKSNLSSFAFYIEQCQSLNRKSIQNRKRQELSSGSNSQRKHQNIDDVVDKKSIFLSATLKNKTDNRKKLKPHKERFLLYEDSKETQGTMNMLHPSNAVNSQRIAKNRLQQKQGIITSSNKPRSLQRPHNSKNLQQQSYRGRIKTQISELSCKKVEADHTLEHKELSSTQRFWKKRGKTWNEQVLKCQTEGKQIKDSSNLTKLIAFNCRENQKAVNYLALQLQVNLACSKRNKVALTYK